MNRHITEARTPPSIQQLRRVVRRIARRHEHRLVVLFGSLARGDPLPRDVDIAVRGNGRLDAIELTNELIRELGFQAVDVCDLSIADPLLQILVARDGQPLYEQTPGEFDLFCSLAIRRFADTRKFRDAERARIRDFIEQTASRP